MPITLHCPRCFCHFTEADSFSADEIGSVLMGEPSFALGDGYTFEDVIQATFREKNAGDCPNCGEDVAISEETLGQLALAMLADF
jgi:hypothetical protein